MPSDTLTLEQANAEHEAAFREETTMRARLNALYDSSKKDDGGWELTPTVGAEINSLRQAVEGLAAKRAGLQMQIGRLSNATALDGMLGRPAPGTPPLFSGQPAPPIDGSTFSNNGGGAMVKAHGSLGEAFVAEPSLKTWTRGSRQAITAEISQKAFADSRKAAIVSTGLTGYERVPSVFGVQQQKLTVRDLMPQGQTDKTTIRYLRETSPRTSTVGMVAENAQKPEQVFAFSEVDAPVRKIGGHTKASDELLEDYAGVASFINEQLPFEVLKKEEQQLLNGLGTGQEILGILNVPGIQSQALTGPDNNADTIFKAMMKIISVGFMEPNSIVIHPTNWQSIRLLKETAGAYIWGPPSVVGPDTLWGLPVVVTTAIAVGTGVVFSRRAVQIFFRQGVQVESTNADQNDFIFNRVTIRAEERLALATYYPLGICAVTGLSST